MRNLSSLLERFKKSLGKDTLAREAVINCVESLTSIKLGLEEISIKENVLEIKTSAGKKNEIRLKEDLILDTLQTRFGLPINRIFYK